MQKLKAMNTMMVSKNPKKKDSLKDFAIKEKKRILLNRQSSFWKTDDEKTKTPSPTPSEKERIRAKEVKDKFLAEARAKVRQDMAH